MTAVSTAWNAARHAGWAPAVRELFDLGFPAVALDGAALHSDAAAVRRAVTEAKGSLVALFAPEPVRGAASPAGDGSLVDARADRRAAAVAALGAAAQAATAAGAPVVVVRAGRIATLDASREDRWTERLGREGRTDALDAEVAAAVADLAPDRSRALDAVCRSLWEACRAFPDVTFALETPATLDGAPFPSEIALVLSELRGRRAAYWHDTAHAARLGALGAADPREWIARAGSGARGVTFSDWAPPVLGAPAGRLPVGAGIVDWASVRAQLAAPIVRVVRIAPEHPAALLAESVRAASA